MSIIEEPELNVPPILSVRLKVIGRSFKIVLLIYIFWIQLLNLTKATDF